MSAPAIVIDLSKSVNSRLSISGKIDRDIFALNDLSITSDGPLSYDLLVQRDGSSLEVTGRVECPFQLECVRCLNPFPFVVTLPEFEAVLAIENDRIIDLTDRVREDILLALPGYPRCEMSSDPGRICPAADRFDPLRDELGDTGSEDRDNKPGSGVWDSLDEFPGSGRS